MKLHKYIRILLFVLIIVYFAQGSLYEEGSLLSQATLFSILGLSGIYFIKTLDKPIYKNLFYKSFTALMLINIVGYIFTGNHSEPIYFNQLKTILIAALPFYPFYYFAQNKILKERHLFLFFIFLIPVIIADFYFSKDAILATRVSNFNIVNNAAYSFVFLIPYVFLIKHKKIVSSLIMLLLLFFIVEGAKRGALITGVIGAVFFAYYQLRTIEKKNRALGFLFVGIGITVIAFYGYKYYISNEYLVERMISITQGDSSGRDEIYASLFNSWYESNSYINLLFGFGFASTLTVSESGHFAHNDWLELLTNFGLLGVIIYVTMFYAAIRYALDKKLSIDKRLLMMAIVSMWFMTTAVSMNYTSSNAMYQNILIAFLMANYNTNKRTKLNLEYA